jgi:predicted DNA-binding protein
MITTLTEKLARLALLLREVAQDIDYHRGTCPVSHALAQSMQDYAEEVDDFSLAIDITEKESTRH